MFESGNPLTGLTGFQRDLLFSVAWFNLSEGVETVSGEELRGVLEEQYSEERILSGRLYPNLSVLCDKGLVERHKVGRRRKEYALSDSGVRVVREFVDEVGFVA